MHQDTPYGGVICTEIDIPQSAIAGEAGFMPSSTMFCRFRGCFCNRVAVESPIETVPTCDHFSVPALRGTAHTIRGGTTLFTNDTSSTQMRKRSLVLAATTMTVWTGMACISAPRMDMTADAYRIDVKLDPVAHTLRGETTIWLSRADDRPLDPESPAAFELLLHPDLTVTEVVIGGAELRRHSTRRSKPPDGHGAFVARTHVLTLERPSDSLMVRLAYEGMLYQDVSAGEKQGEIHNFSMKAHISNEGIYLGGGHWYPQPVLGDDVAPTLAEYTLITDPLADIELVAGAEHDAALSEETGRLAWRSPYPLDGMVLVGGRHEVHRATHHGTDIAVHLKPEQAEQGPVLVQFMEKCLDRYEPLIGAYPARSFATVNNFFSSGFAFPTFTLLASAVIDMGADGWTKHGYIDHEILHCWWGNGIHVDPRDGNWCEALASYGANYYGYVLDGDDEGARRMRRNYCHFLSDIKAEDDKPLGTFGLKDGCGRGIAYSKGAMVFHMLARTIGQENFWAAMRRFTEEYVGKYASWDDIQRLCEETGGKSLDGFFEQWVRGRGAPRLSIETARYDASTQRLTLALSQEGGPFEIDVPIRVTHAGGTLDLTVPLVDAKGEVVLAIDVIPLGVRLDPDYHVFRKVSATERIPTSTRTRRGEALVSIVAAGDPSEEYVKLRDLFEKPYEDEDARQRWTTGQAFSDGLRERCVLILGDAVNDPTVGSFLAETELPVRWIEGGFVYEGVEYKKPEHGILCTIRHPNLEKGGVTIIYANSESAIPRSAVVLYYPYSIVIFDDHKPVVRDDFELSPVVAVE